MSELTVDRLRENLESLKMKNTLEILDNYLERAVADKLNIVEVLDYIFSEEAKFKRKRAYEKQVQVSGFPCCFSERMRKLFRKNEKNVLRFCNKKAKEKRRLQRVKKPM